MRYINESGVAMSRANVEGLERRAQLEREREADRMADSTLITDVENVDTTENTSEESE